MLIETEEKTDQVFQEDQDDQVEKMLEEFEPVLTNEDSNDSEKEEDGEELEEEEYEVENEEKGNEDEDDDESDEEEDESDEEKAKDEDTDDKDSKEDEKKDESEEEIEEEEDLTSSLIKQLEEVSAKVNIGGINLNAKEKTPEQLDAENREDEIEKSEYKEKESIQDLLPFVSDEVYEKALSDPKELNTLMNKVYNTAISNMTKSLPQLMGNMISQQTQMQKLASDFYQENTDLVSMKNYVGFVANELAGRHPDWDYEKLFGEVALEVRKRLKISKEAKKVEGESKKNRPAFAKKPKGRTKRTEKLSELEEDLVELM
jgi:hypothetical protein